LRFSYLNTPQINAVVHCKIPESIKTMEHFMLLAVLGTKTGALSGCIFNLEERKWVMKERDLSRSRQSG
jgi:hypothetical protein